MSEKNRKMEDEIFEKKLVEEEMKEVAGGQGDSGHDGEKGSESCDNSAVCHG